MIRSLLVSCLTLFLIYGSIKAEELKITNIIEIGEASNLSYLGAVKWSPDGNRLAYYSEGSFVIVDTLGNVLNTIPNKNKPKKFEWWSNDELVFEQVLRPKRNESHLTLYKLNIESTELSTLEEYTSIAGHGKQATYENLAKNSKGDVNYTKIEGDQKRIIYSNHSLREKSSRTLSNSKIIFEEKNGELINISNDFKDTLKFESMKIRRPYFSIKASNDNKYILSENYLYNLKDGEGVKLSELAKNELQLEDKSCGIGFNTLFNPIYNELLFELCCETITNENEDLNNYIVIYNLDDNSFTNLTTDFDLGFSTAPSYSPDGLKIAFLATNKIMIVNREVVQ